MTGSPDHHNEAGVTIFSDEARKRGYQIYDDDDGTSPDTPQDIPVTPTPSARSQEVVGVNSWSDNIAHARAALADFRHRLVWHVLHVPHNAARLMWYTTRGVGVALGAPFVWASAERGNYDLRQHLADTNQAREWLRMDQHRIRVARWRWFIVATGGAGVASGGVWLHHHPLSYAQTTAVVAAALTGCALLGRPQGKPLLIIPSAAPVWTRLTAENAFAALLSLELPKLNAAVKRDPAALRLVHDIVRDGPGHLAVIDLPEGVLATDVITRRARLASGLRLPHNQVWPTEGTGSEHPGRLHLWVGLRPAHLMPSPAWPWLKRPVPHSVYDPAPMAHAPRGAAVHGLLPERNYLVGGEPGSGKTTFVRTLMMTSLMDPYAETMSINFKGTGDFRGLSGLMSLYVNGMDDGTRQLGLHLLRWLRGECERRAARVDAFVAQGLTPKAKVTRHLHELPGSGLHHLTISLDEVQELFGHPIYGREAQSLTIGIIKVVRALGITLILSTQTAEGESIPVAVTRACSNRWAGALSDYRANDMILGSGMWAAGYRANQFKITSMRSGDQHSDTARDDAGWGLAVGFGTPQPLCSYQIDADDERELVAQIRQWRAAAGTTDRRSLSTLTTVDLLSDLATVWPTGQDRAWCQTLASALARLRPDEYRNFREGTPEQISRKFADQARACGLIVQSQVWGSDERGGKRNLAGVLRADLDSALNHDKRGRKPA